LSVVDKSTEKDSNFDSSNDETRKFGNEQRMILSRIFFTRLRKVVLEMFIVSIFALLLLYMVLKGF
jgi:hypothetical protein